MVDFVLALVVLVPLVLGIVQVGLVLHVRNTLTNAASEGARYAAALDRGPADGVVRTRQQITGAISARFAQEISATTVAVGGVPGIRVTVAAEVPPLGVWGPGIRLEAVGHAVSEELP